MKAYLFLTFAILSELLGTSMLKASDGFTKLYPSIATVISFGLAFYLLSLSLQHIPLGTAYAIWSGAGTAITAIVGVVIWKETVSVTTVAGILLIIAGVVILNLKVASQSG
ncbi:QacE family quaternary ammonium compound efflux SMR transporter [Paenibacillus nanensis]|uniref:QacE family quaternary ammonium compound efflux SMR transporter n=1 Tax=Paenibacillus nanensis TaxID=393251 RepID=A0A3A1VIJ1_9BACL|nr:multidrug efflux SMR transporter [Paenibacillus nanensis]RIX60075.1 QacE family quaternary ammonium compound efflux SMR transporter [Paenibacillus nanensis]